MTRLPFLTAQVLGRRFAHGFFGRRGGVSTGDHASLNAAAGAGDSDSNVSRNRALIARALGVSCLVTVSQTHSNRVSVIESADQAQASADGMVTSLEGVGLTVLTADCAPVLLGDAGAGVIAVAHAGWRGAFSGIIEATVEAMFAHGAQSITAAIGPCLTQASFEVGPELERICLEVSDWAGQYFISGRADRRQFDLKGYVRRRLEFAGVATIEVLEQDTLSDSGHFFSARASRSRNFGYGSNASCIALV